MCLETGAYLVSNVQQARWICSASARQRAELEWAPKQEGLNPERLAFGCSTEQSLKERQKAGQRGKKRNEQCGTGGRTRAGEKRWLGRRKGLAFPRNNQEADTGLSILTSSLAYWF